MDCLCPGLPVGLELRKAIITFDDGITGSTRLAGDSRRPSAEGDLPWETDASRSTVHEERAQGRADRLGSAAPVSG
jgi:hypothetical protein